MWRKIWLGIFLIMGSGCGQPVLVDSSLVSPTSTPTPVIEVMQLAWFSKPPNEDDLDLLAEHFDVYVLTHLDEPERAELKSLGVTQPFLQYLRFDAIQDPGSCTAQPWHNQVAHEPGDFCFISQQHPDWFLLDAAGQRINDPYDSTFVFMDPGQTGWRVYWLERAQQLQEEFGWDGVFLDNVESSLARHEEWERTLLHYQTDSDYQEAVEGFLKFLYQDYFEPQGKPLYANILGLKDPVVWAQYLNYFDGAMDEFWGVRWADYYYSPEEWAAKLTLAETTQAAGKHFIAVTNGSRANTSRQEFALASYLLISNGAASFRYGEGGHWNEMWFYQNYLVDLGQPLGARYQVGEAWRRDFVNGSVEVNPVEHTSSITIH